MITVEKKGYAKVNLHLDVLSRYADGYHEVNTVMQSVSLCDDVKISIDDKINVIQISCDNSVVPLDNSNIAYKAASLFLDAIGQTDRLGIKISITKRIPVSAGLGGGSADAAAVLCGLNELWDKPLSRDELLSLGAKLGADVPFCMIGGTAYADGKGERIHELSDSPCCYFVVARGGEGVSTPWAYSMLDKKFNNFSKDTYFPNNCENIVNALKSGVAEDLGKSLYNVFEEAILPERPIAAAIKQMLLENGAIGALMSGSGTAVFGVFSDKETAETAARNICAHGYFACVALPTKKYF